MPPVPAVGSLRMRWRTARDDHWRVELPCLQTTAQCCNATGGQSIQSGRDNVQLKENNAELIKLAKAQCNANDTIRDKDYALVEEVACLRIEINHGNEIRAMNDKLDQLSSDLTNLSQAPTERESYAAVASSKTNKRVFMFHDHILRDIHKVTAADNEPVALHTTSRATPKDLLITVQWREVCKEADELTIVCSGHDSS